MLLFLSLLVAGCVQPPCEGRDCPLDDDATADRGPCPAYFGAGAEGSWRQWETTSAQEAETGRHSIATITVTRVDDGAVELTRETSWTDDGGEGTGLGVLTYRCDAEGAWLLHQTSRTDFVDQDGEGWSTFEATYDPPHLALPVGGPGTTWAGEIDYTYEMDSSYGYGGGGPNSYELTVVLGSETETTTTPAGSFDTIEVTQDQTAHDITNTDRWRAHAELGRVVYDGRELVAYGP